MGVSDGGSYYFDVGNVRLKDEDLFCPCLPTFPVSPSPTGSPRPLSVVPVSSATAVPRVPVTPTLGPPTRGFGSFQMGRRGPDLRHLVVVCPGTRVPRARTLSCTSFLTLRVGCHPQRPYKGTLTFLVPGDVSD